MEKINLSKRIHGTIFLLLLSLNLLTLVIVTATDIKTGAYIPPGSGSPPIIKAKWERPDDDPTRLGTQVLPPMTWNGLKTVTYWAVVTDPNGIGNLDRTYVDVYHPDGSFKYQVQLFEVEDIQTAINEITDAYNMGIVTFGPGYDLDEVIAELEQFSAKAYRGYADLDYHQMCGEDDRSYEVFAYAFDKENSKSEFLKNTFDYICVAGVELDFNSIDFEEVMVSSDKWVEGDYGWNECASGFCPACNGDLIGTPPCRAPTLRNVGNTPTKIRVWFDDMQFGKTLDEWNVEYDARLDLNSVVYFDPETWTELPGTLDLCTTDKISFSIHVFKADPESEHRGTSMIEPVPVEFPWWSYCGDGVVDPNEECDDGNNINGDGCSETCEHEITFPPAGEECYLTNEKLEVEFFDIQGPIPIETEGVTRIKRGDPVKDDDLQEIPTEIVQMELTGVSPTLGPITVRLNNEANSTGNITSDNFISPFPADSFFDVFFEIDIPSIDKLTNSRASHRWGVVSGIPFPPGTKLRSLNSVNLSNTSGNVVGKVNKVNTTFLENITCPICGNEIIEPGEECDDGNTADGDGCSSDCMLEPVLPPEEYFNNFYATCQVGDTSDFPPPETYYQTILRYFDGKLMIVQPPPDLYEPSPEDVIPLEGDLILNLMPTGTHLFPLTDNGYLALIELNLHNLTVEANWTIVINETGIIPAEGNRTNITDDTIVFHTKNTTIVIQRDGHPLGNVSCGPASGTALVDQLNKTRNGTIAHPGNESVINVLRNKMGTTAGTGTTVWGVVRGLARFLNQSGLSGNYSIKYFGNYTHPNGTAWNGNTSVEGTGIAWRSDDNITWIDYIRELFLTDEFVILRIVRTNDGQGHFVTGDDLRIRGDVATREFHRYISFMDPWDGDIKEVELTGNCVTVWGDEWCVKDMISVSPV